MEHCLGDRTLLEGVKVLPPATILDYRDGLIDKTRYSSLDVTRWVAEHERSPEESFTVLDGLLGTAVCDAVNSSERPAIALTGGLDSRILAGYAREANPNISSFFVGDEGCWDHILGNRVAATLGMPYIRFPVFPLPSDSLPRLWKEWASPELSLRHAHLLGPIRNIKDSYDCILSGVYGGELFGQRSRDIDMSGVPQHARLLHVFRGFYDRTGIALSPESFFAADLAEAYWETLRFSLHVAVGDNFEGDSFEMTDRFVRDEHCRRFSRVGDPFTFGACSALMSPFLNFDIARFAYRLSKRDRLKQRFYQRFLSWRFPSLAAIPWQYTGRPLLSSSQQKMLDPSRRYSRPGPRAFTCRWPEIREWLRNCLPSWLTDLVRKQRIDQILSSNEMAEADIGTASVLATVIGFFERCSSDHCVNKPRKRPRC